MERVNIKFHLNGTISFQEKRTYTFVRGLSVGDLEDRVVTPNIPLITAADFSRGSVFTRAGLMMLATSMDARPLHAVSVHDFVWGHNDSFAVKAAEAALLLQKPVPSAFGILSTTPDGLLALRYKNPRNVFSSPESNPDNSCFCIDSHCAPEGLQNTKPCSYGAPVYISFPHFLMADKKVHSDVMGLRPNSAIHSTHIDIHEVSTDFPSNCNICGNTHSTENCPFLQNVEIIRDTFTLSRARLSLPKGLEVIDFVDGSTSVIARSRFKRGVQFGPLIARKAPDFDVSSNFPMKIFSEDIPSEKCDDWQYLDTSNEHLCNWMCLVAPATCLEEQNLICFQMKREVFFLLVRDVEPGEQLRVWYAPQYGVEMLAKQLQSSLTNEEVLPVHVEEPVGPTTDYLSPREKKKKKKLAKSKLIAQSINYSPELRDRLASKLPSAILGAKNLKSEWDCAKCGFKSKLLSEYAKHLMTHR
ncbi:hypothetical protein LSTR_LSTR010151 [Laodelphax striatellus]|uniref:Scavenger receptor class B member 1 n=1 Tax=Laodelphax striatellus TaxID=195883 RepID=A0A482WJ02_LAOST|nr:hypothetical protein LSTR_LSTR010151 [Laodelphax striatellus]